MASSSMPQLGQHTQYVSIRHAASLLDLSCNCLREWEKSGKLGNAVYKTLGNHRRYDLKELKRIVLGVEEDKSKAGGKKAHSAYCRCSSNSQKDSLKNQVIRVVDSVVAREGIDESDVAIYREVVSAFSDRKKINELLDHIIAGNIETITVEFPDRLYRVGPQKFLIEHIAKQFNVKIFYLNDAPENKTASELMAAELLAYVTVLANRFSSAKSSRLTRKTLDDSIIKKIKEGYGQGKNIRQIHKQLKQEGTKTTDGSVISYTRVHQVILALKKVIPDLGEKTTFDEFAKTHISKEEGSKTNSKLVFEEYTKWCSNRNIEPIARRKVGLWLSANFCEKYVSQDRHIFKHIKLKPYKQGE